MFILNYFFNNTITVNREDRIQEIKDHIRNLDTLVAQVGNRIIFTPIPDLSECNCKWLNRLKNFKRELLENEMIASLDETHKDKNACINVLSMGSEELLGEFLFLEKMVLAGFTNISIDCVDPKEIAADKMQKIRDFFKEVITLNISAYKSIDEVPEVERGYSAVLAIDYAHASLLGAQLSVSERFRATTDLMKAQRRLNDLGCLALAFGGEATALYSKSFNAKNPTSSPSLLQLWTADLKQYISEKTELSIAFSDIYAPGINLLMYALAVVAETSSDLKTISVSFLSDPTRSKSEEFVPDIMHSLFPNQNILIHYAPQEGIKYDLFLTHSLEPEFASDNYLNSLGPNSLTYICSFFPAGGGQFARQIGNKKNLEQITASEEFLELENKYQEINSWKCLPIGNDFSKKDLCLELFKIGTPEATARARKIAPIIRDDFSKKKLCLELFKIGTPEATALAQEIAPTIRDDIHKKNLCLEVFKIGTPEATALAQKIALTISDNVHKKNLCLELFKIGTPEGTALAQEIALTISEIFWKGQLSKALFELGTPEAAAFAEKIKPA